MVIKTPLDIRPVQLEDRSKLANLIHFEQYVHRHLDWRPPLEWIGEHPYLVAQQGSQVVAALACPPDPPGVAWIRLFAASSQVPLERAWRNLWEEALQQLLELPNRICAAAIPLQRWFPPLLEANDFVKTSVVVMLSWDRHMNKLAPPNPEVAIRPMNLDDIALVEEIDAAAFIPVWQNSKYGLEEAFRQAAIATIAEHDGEVVGYQISTATPIGGHLARLAVLPKTQGHGVGYALLHDVLSQFRRRGAQTVTVNTQHDNSASLALYQKAGFRLTGEEYPFYEFDLLADRPPAG
jgi:ribosomal protein S18 acetylase RimI-like enzyme